MAEKVNTSECYAVFPSDEDGDWSKWAAVLLILAVSDNLAPENFTEQKEEPK